MQDRMLYPLAVTFPYSRAHTLVLARHATWSQAGTLLEHHAQSHQRSQDAVIPLLRRQPGCAT